MSNFDKIYLLLILFNIVFQAFQRNLSASAGWLVAALLLIQLSITENDKTS
jgi:hypothetical protein